MSDTVFLGTVVHTPHVDRNGVLPFLFPEEFNDKASDLLAVAEHIVFTECCENGCISYKDELGGHPTKCRLLYPSQGAPLSCCAFSPVKDGV